LADIVTISGKQQVLAYHWIISFIINLIEWVQFLVAGLKIAIAQHCSMTGLYNDI
jgi:hypothetical protein